jgi:hypothetical protein
MSRIFRWTWSLALPVIFSTLALAQQPAAAAVDHLQPMRWMVGKTWTSDAADPSSGKKTHIESVIRTSPNGASIEFVTTFDGKPQYNGFYAWDPATRQIRFWYTSSEGELTQGTAHPEGDGLLQTFTITGVEGKVSPLRSHVKPVSADAYDWNVEAERDGKWVELIHLRYTRKA